MFFKKKVVEEIKHSREGKILIDLLSSKKDWELTEVTYHNMGLPYKKDALKHRSGLTVKSVHTLIQVSSDGGEYCSSFFNFKDGFVIGKMVDNLINELKSEPVRKKLFQLAKSQGCRDGIGGNTQENC